MPSEVFGGIAAFKAMMDIAKALKDMDSAASRNAAVIDLQEKIFSAHAAQTALLEKVGELEAKVAGFEKWEGEKQRYEMKQLAPGFVAYVLKEPERLTAPPHAICTNCYERGFKSVLQSNGEIRVHDHAFICPACKAKFACQSRHMDRLIAGLDQEA
jgi:Zn finger protein HypA/HybF involved in hydrogenase expression